MNRAVATAAAFMPPLYAMAGNKCGQCHFPRKTIVIVMPSSVGGGGGVCCRIALSFCGLLRMLEGTLGD